MKHTFRGVVTAWLSLIALQAVAKAGSGRVASFFGDVDHLVQRALSPSVPAIPDRRAGAATAATYFGVTPQAAKAGASVAQNMPGVNAGIGAFANPTIGQYVGGGGLPAGIADNPALHPAG